MIKVVFKIAVLIGLLVGLWSCGGQETPTYHYPETFYRMHQLIPETVITKEYAAKKGRDSSNVTIGWHPYYLENTTESYDFSLLHSIIFYGYEWNQDNTTEVLTAWNKANFVEAAQSAGCRVIFSASNYGALRSKHFFDSLEVQAQFMNDVIYYLELQDADGVEIDFPAVGANNRIDFANFIKTFYIRLKQYKPQAVLYISLPFHDKNNAFDIKTISPFVDLFIIGGNNSTNTNFNKLNNEPIAPVEFPENDSISLVAAVKGYSDKGLDLFKVILELPYYTSVKQQEVKKNGETEHYHNFYSYQSFIKTYGHHERKYDAVAKTAYVEVDNPESSGDIRLYFDDSLSLAAKYDWAMSQGFRGVGVWALGFDNGSTDFWQVLDRRSQKTTNINGVANTPFSLGGYFSRYTAMYQAWLSILLGLVFLGSLIAMIHWQSRDQLTDWNTFRLYYLFIGATFCFFLLSFFPISPILILILGGILGAAMTYLVNIYINREIENEP